MKYIITHDGVEHEVDVTNGDGGCWKIVLDGEDCEVDFCRIDGAEIYSLIVDNASFELLIVASESETSVIQSGRSIDLNVESTRQHQARLIADDGAGGGDQIVRSVMPGIVVAISVSVGDRVEADQSLCVLEAMKMENEITAKAPGVVRNIPIDVGHTVGGGDVLLELSPLLERED